jgi:hypothetical protein
MKPRSFLAAILPVAWVWTRGILRETSLAQKESVPKQTNTAAIASNQVKELVALVDTDWNGNISNSSG